MRASTLLLALAVSALLAGPAQATAAKGTPPARMKAIVRAWSARLNAGDNAGVAKLFALPARMIQGPYVYRLTKRSQVALWHSSLPCSGHIISIRVRGRYATAVFILGNRQKSKCDGPGMLAAARFTIVRGKIVTWEQVAVPAENAPSGSTA
jgi:hypothetical protein